MVIRMLKIVPFIVHNENEAYEAEAKTETKLKPTKRSSNVFV